MTSGSHCLAIVLGLLVVLDLGQAIRCYSCNSTVNANCNSGSSSLPTITCRSGEVCATYQYDVYLLKNLKGTGTSRGCETDDQSYCGFVESALNVLIKPASVKERNCYTCKKDLCNSSTVLHTSLFAIVFALLAKIILV